MASINGVECDEATAETKKSWRTNLFGVYAKVFKVMLSNWKGKVEPTNEENRSKELDALVLPSNEEWRYQVYYRLVDLQREIDSGQGNTFRIEDGAENAEEPRTTILKEMSLTKTSEWEATGLSMSFWERASNKSIDYQSSSSLDVGSMTEEFIDTAWRISDILLAAKVLHKNTTAQEMVFTDEAEMRRVFGLTYDALRYKLILNQTLEDSEFWKNYEVLRDRERIVWLLLYDMQGRKFSNFGQTSLQAARQEAFRVGGIQEIEEALMEMKTRLAASVSRLRISGSALTLEDLLPMHLKTSTGVCWTDENSIASGWVNTRKIPNKCDFINEMLKLNLKVASDNEELGDDNYIFDPVCPKLVNFREKIREKIAMSMLVGKHCFIFLERTTCLGAAALVRAVKNLKLCGPVILTHPIAPRHTGYLAGLLVDIDEAGRLLAFGTAAQRGEYETYLKNLGFSDREVGIFAENYSEAPGFAEMERATIVLANPPCSYTGIRDIVDLCVARGGDTNLLESLTTVDEKSQLEKPQKLLAEQLSSLKYALTRPNVQLLIYQVYSVLPSETTEMMKQVIEYANKIATDKYTKDHTKRRSPKDASPKSGRSARTPKQMSMHHDAKSRSHEEEDDDEIRAITDIHVPNSDLFELGCMADLNADASSITIPESQNGCYLGLVKRKEMMQFNSLFMIKVAESRGLFGDPNAKPKSPEPPEPVKEEPKHVEERKKKKKKKGQKAISLGRITAPTHAYILKKSNDGKTRKPSDDASSGFSWGKERFSCPKYSQRIAKDEDSQSAQVLATRRTDARKWWEQSATFLIHAARCKSCKFRIFHTDPWTRRVLYPPRIQRIVFNGEI